MRIRTRSIIILLSQSSAQVCTFLLAIILVRLLPQEIFGSFQQVFMIYFFISGVLSFQLDSSIFYFIPKYGKPERRKILTQSIILSMGSALIISVIMFFGAKFISEFIGNKELYYLIRSFSIYPLGERILFIIPAFMISLEKAFNAGIYILLSSFARFAIVILFILAGADLGLTFFALSIFIVVLAIVGCIDMFRKTEKFGDILDIDSFMEQIKFCSPLIVTAVVGTISLQLDKILISRAFSPGIYAVYSCGAFELPIISLLTISITSAIMPDLVKYFECGKTVEGLYLWQEAARKCSFLIFPCAVFFFFTASDLVIVLFGINYLSASLPFRIYLCALPFRIAIYASLFRALGNTKPIALSAIIALSLNFIIGISLVKIGGQSTLSFIGPAIGAIVGTIVSINYLLWNLKGALNIPYKKIMRWKELSVLFAISTACGLIMYAVPLETLLPLWRIITQAIMFILLYIVILLISKTMKSDEIELMLVPMRFIPLLSKSTKSNSAK